MAFDAVAVAVTFGATARTGVPVAFEVFAGAGVACAAVFGAGAVFVAFDVPVAFATFTGAGAAFATVFDAVAVFVAFDVTDLSDVAGLVVLDVAVAFAAFGAAAALVLLLVTRLPPAPVTPPRAVQTEQSSRQRSPPVRRRCPRW